MFRVTTVAALVLAAGPLAGQGPGLPTQTWPAGTYLGAMDKGGRVTTFHRGWLYLGAQDDTSVWDISDPTDPQMEQFSAIGVNGHSWYKIGDLFWRQYWIPEHLDADPPQFQSLANPLVRVPWTQPMHFPIGTWRWHFLSTYPLSIGNDVVDVRTGQQLSDRNLSAEDGINAGLSFRIGNLLFFTPGDEQTGVSVFDVGDPANPVLLDVLSGNFRQYTTAWQVWRNYVVLMSGDETNGPDQNANLVAIDFSDPTDLQVGFTLPYATLPGRYVHFQDEFGFAGRFNVGRKVNLETGQIAQSFQPPPGGVFEDFQWIPLGHLLMMSQAQVGSSHSYLYAHRPDLDDDRPYVGYHLPVDGAVDQPVGTVIGLVINEELDDTTIHDGTIEVRPLGGASIEGTVVSTQYDVVNFTPEPALLPNTTYEVRVRGDGIRDLAGNRIQYTTFRFSTGPSLATCILCDGFESGDTGAWSTPAP